MLEIIRGSTNKPVSSKSLISILNKLEYKHKAILFLGYPLIEYEGENNSMDALFISEEYGFVLFDIVEESTFSDRKELQNNLFNLIFSRLITQPKLVQNQGILKLKPEIVTFSPAWNKYTDLDFKVLYSAEDIDTFLRESNRKIDEILYKDILEVIQSVTKLKKRPKRDIKNESSKGAFLKRIESSVSNLDKNQNQAIIETSKGIQRIRGLAGSGKTIVLALKVAYLHTQHPDWLIGVTFHTRSLKQQFTELIRDFTIEQIKEEPNWDKIKILNAWGSYNNPGIYYNFCILNNLNYIDYSTARDRFGDLSPFDKVCDLALEQIKQKEPVQIFDSILIDEAQDLSESFLNLCYMLLKPSDVNNKFNKRLIYAYDELQKLNKLTLRNPKEIFGQNIDFDNKPDEPKQDIVLEVCYRNSKTVIVTAHSLGFGIYREKGLVQMFGNTEIWSDVGYEVKEGKLSLGNPVTLSRRDEANPEGLYSSIPPTERMVFKCFSSNKNQSEWIAKEIMKNLTTDELTHKDIIVIHPDPIVARKNIAYLRSLLFDAGIKSHLAGVNTSPDTFYENNSITFTNIYRAKGNETAMVYIMNAEYCFEGQELIKKRNILFTAITRSKCWVRLCGVGDSMNRLILEYNKLCENNYDLKFKYPTTQEMEHLNVIHRELTKTDRNKITKSNTQLTDIVDMLENKELHPEDIPEELWEKLSKYTKRK